MSQIVIEASVRMNAAVHYFARSLLQGCQLEVIRQEIKIIQKDSFEYYMMGRASVAPGTVLTYWSEAGEITEFWRPEFWIMQVNPAQPVCVLGERQILGLPEFFKGPVEIVAHGRGDEEAPRLRKWWLKWAPANGGQNVAIARWLAKELRGQRDNPRDYAGSLSEKELKHAFLPIDGWVFQNAQTGRWFT